MGAKVLTMSGGEETQGEEQETTQHRRASYYAEDQTVPYLFVGKDKSGKAVYFIRVGVTGLRPRVFGPFRRKGDAIMAFDGLLGQVLEGFMDLANASEETGRSNFSQLMIEPPNNLATVR